MCLVPFCSWLLTDLVAPASPFMVASQRELKMRHFLQTQKRLLASN